MSNIQTIPIVFQIWCQHENDEFEMSETGDGVVQIFRKVKLLSVACHPNPTSAFGIVE
jgi:hypothetical protein